MTFWKPGTVAPGVDIPVTLIDQDEGAQGKFENDNLFFNPRASMSLTQQRQSLPIFSHRKELLYLIEKHPVVVVVGQTGSGKTTQIPQYLYEGGWTRNNHCVAITQPRRVAAVTIAKRVAEETGGEVGGVVGYAVRFEDCTSPATRLKFCTDGLLLREIMFDPLLKRYSVIMVDEAHERSVHSDILLGLLSRIRAQRPDLRIIISSATIDANVFAEFFSQTIVLPGPRGADGTATTRRLEGADVASISIEGRMFPLDIMYLPKPLPDYVSGVVETVTSINSSQGPGDVLVFLPGQEQIDTVVELLSQVLPRARTPRMAPLPLYAGLPYARQMKVFEPTARGCRKVVCATTIAETSITIEGVVFVVDPGFTKQRYFDPRRGLDTLMVSPCSRQQAQQRAGRAGRTRRGKVFRLYPEKQFSALPAQTTPEVQRVNLAPVILQLKSLGISDILRFSFPAPPPVPLLGRGLEDLYALRAIAPDARLTSLGRALAEFPCDPWLGRMLLAGQAYGVREEVLTIGAMLSVQVVFRPGMPKQRLERLRAPFTVHEGDHITLLNAYTAWAESRRGRAFADEHGLVHTALRRVQSIRGQLAKYVHKFGRAVKVEPVSGKRSLLGIVCRDPPSDAPSRVEAIQRAICDGYFGNAARRQPDSSYLTLRDGQRLELHPTSCVFGHPPPCVVFHGVTITEKSFMREVVAIEEAWLPSVAPHFYEIKKPNFAPNPEFLK